MDFICRFTAEVKSVFKQALEQEKMNRDKVEKEKTWLDSTMEKIEKNQPAGQKRPAMSSAWYEDAKKHKAGAEEPAASEPCARCFVCNRRTWQQKEQSCSNVECPKNLRLLMGALQEQFKALALRVDAVDLANTNKANIEDTAEVKAAEVPADKPEGEPVNKPEGEPVDKPAGDAEHK